MYVVETHDLTKVYSGKAVVDHTNMHIPEGSIYGFVGENGSGKTTIMRLITGIASPSAGSFDLFGVKNNDIGIMKARKNIAAIVETVSLVPSMSAYSNIVYQELYQGMKLTKDERKKLLELVHLDQTGKKKAGNFSLGMRQRLGIACALIGKPKFLLLDEPMNGLDPQGIADLRDLILELNQKEGITILISSHILSELEKVATVFGFISHGKIIEELSVQELQDKCRKSLEMKFADPTLVEPVLKALGVKEFKAYPNGDVKIFDEIDDLGAFISKINDKKAKLLSINSSDENVEDYYFDLIKGGKTNA